MEAVFAKENSTPEYIEDKALALVSLNNFMYEKFRRLPLTLQD